MGILDPIVNAATDAAAAELRALLNGAAADVESSVRECTDRAIRAVAEGRSDLLPEILGQIRVIGERNRLRATAAGWAAATSVLGAVVGVVGNLATGGLLQVAAGLAKAADRLPGDPRSGAQG